MRIKRLMKCDVKYVRETATIRDACRAMVKNGIGCVLVENQDGELAGILTESDVVRCVAQGRTPDEPVSAEMTKKVITIDSSADVADAINLMVKKKIKKLVVMHNGRVVGLATATDILHLGDEIENELLMKLAHFFPIQRRSVAG